MSTKGNWIDQKLDYILDKPVEAGWVTEPEKFEHSSARNYAGKLGRMQVISIFDGVEI